MKTKKEQVYVEYICRTCGDPCILRVFDTCAVVSPQTCPYRREEENVYWTKREVYDDFVKSIEAIEEEQAKNWRVKE